MLDLLIRITSTKNGNHGASAAAAASAIAVEHCIDIMKKEDSVIWMCRGKVCVCVFYEDSTIELDLHGNVMCKRDRERG